MKRLEEEAHGQWAWLTVTPCALQTVNTDMLGANLSNNKQVPILKVTVRGGARRTCNALLHARKPHPNSMLELINSRLFGLYLFYPVSSNSSTWPTL